MWSKKDCSQRNRVREVFNIQCFNHRISIAVILSLVLCLSELGITYSYTLSAKSENKLNPVKKSVSNPLKISVCYEGKMIANPHDCAGFLTCLNKELVPHKCATGSRFDPNWEVCVVDQKRLCISETELCVEGEVKPDLNSRIEYFACLNSNFIKKKCPNGSYFDSSWKVCVVENGSNRKTESCTKGDIKKDANDSTRYFKCLEGSYASQICLQGSYFDEVNKMCIKDTPTAHTCKAGDIIIDPEDNVGYFECLNGEYSSQRCSHNSFFDAMKKICVTEKCREGEIREDSDDESGFFECVEGNFESQRCKRGSSFDAVKKICVINALNTERCREADVREDPDDESGYFECNDGEYASLRCTRGSHFDAVKKMCLNTNDRDVTKRS